VGQIVKILGIDTATSCGGVGLIDDDAVVAEYAFHREETPSAQLIPAIQALLQEARITIHEIDGMAVSVGPGSFTGLRVGLSTVKGFALAAERPVAGVPTLEALAAQLPSTPSLICPIVDARKGEVYTALYKQREGGRVEQLSPYQVLSPSKLFEEIPLQEMVFVGDGVDVYGELIRERLTDKAFFASPHLNCLRGSTVAELGLQHIKKGEKDDISSLVPIYVRRSDAEIKWAQQERD
jgi:tRNA threonylcarbamoyladenosine biosynthesis protein TsaB